MAFEHLLDLQLLVVKAPLYVSKLDLEDAIQLLNRSSFQNFTLVTGYV